MISYGHIWNSIISHRSQYISLLCVYCVISFVGTDSTVHVIWKLWLLRLLLLFSLHFLASQCHFSIQFRGIDSSKSWMDKPHFHQVKMFILYFPDYYLNFSMEKCNIVELSRINSSVFSIRKVEQIFFSFILEIIIE